MEQVAYGVHEEPDNEYDEDEKYDKDTSEDDESGGHDDIDDKSYPEKLKGNPNQYWIFKTQIKLIWNTTQTKENKGFLIYYMLKQKIIY